MPTDFDLSGSKTLTPLPPPGAAVAATTPSPAAAAQPPTSPRSSTRAATRFAELNNFVDLTMRTLSHTQTKVWLTLFRDARDGVARASQKSIAKRCGVADRTVRRTLPMLEARGLIEVKVRGGLGRGPSVYLVRAVAPE